MLLITGSITRSAKRRHIGYSEGDFEVFRPGGATRCTDWDEIWHGGVDGPLLHAKFHPHRCNDKGIGPLKLKLLRLYQNSEQNFKTLGAYRNSNKGYVPAGRVPCAIFTKFKEFVQRFRTRLKFGWICLRGYGVMGVLSGGSGFPKFSELPLRRNYASDPKSFRGVRTCSTSSITVPSLVGLGFHLPPGRPKTFELFVCVCLSVSVCSSRC